MKKWFRQMKLKRTQRKAIRYLRRYRRMNPEIPEPQNRTRQQKILQFLLIPFKILILLLPRLLQRLRKTDWSSCEVN